VEIFKTFRFESAHRLPHLPASHKCARLHGHSYRVDVHVEGSLDPEKAWVVDFADVAAVADPVIDALDHRYLNEIEGLDNPTCERVAVWIWERLAPRLPGLSQVVVHETCTSGCVYRGPAA
jgi:6-pyruvoyltetrahydropterin/6-carboxytetrahydropterin synthase